jgi:8-hydroxy-5-deazaflavin:NADPH oxidoreductase
MISALQISCIVLNDIYKKTNTFYKLIMTNTTDTTPMNIAIFGTGSVGQALATGLSAVGHSITIGTRNVAQSLAKIEPGAMGTQPVSVLLQAQPSIQLKTFAEAKQNADMIILAVSGAFAVETLEAAGALPAGTIVLDVTNPLDFSKGFPPSLFTNSDESLAERIQARFPQIHLVKTLNTMSNAIMINPDMLQDPGTCFICGNDEPAKTVVKTVLNSLGWSEQTILDLGDLTGARGMEMTLPLWIRVFQTRGNANFNWKVSE